MARHEVANRLAAEVASLRRYALVLTRKPDDAEDLVQECLARAIAAAHGWQPGTDLRAWLFRIMHNAFIDNVRKQRVRETNKPAVVEATEKPVQPTRVELAQVLDALRTLPEHYREPIVLVAIEEMSYADAARVLDVPLGTLMSRLARGREALRRVVRGEKSPHLRLVS